MRITLDTFDEIYGIPRVEKLEFEFLDVGMPNLDAIFQELLMGDDIWDGEVQCNKTRIKDRYLILFLFSCHSLLPLKCTVAMVVARANLL